MSVTDKARAMLAKRRETLAARRDRLDAEIAEIDRMLGGSPRTRSASRTPYGTLVLAVFAYLRANPRASLSDVCEAVGRRNGAVHSTLNYQHSMGRVIREGERGSYRYSLADPLLDANLLDPEWAQKLDSARAAQ